MNEILFFRDFDNDYPIIGKIDITLLILIQMNIFHPLIHLTEGFSGKIRHAFQV